MNLENLLKGIVFLIIAIFIILYEFKDRGIKQGEDASYRYHAVGGAIIFLMLAINYLLEVY